MFLLLELDTNTNKMPLPSTDPGYKTFALKQNGYDPEQYDLTDDGQVIPKEVKQPVANESAEPYPISTKPQQTTATQAALHHAASSVIPTGAGLGSAALTSWLLGPEVGLPVSLAAGIAAGLGGGYAGEKAQNALMPQSAKDTLATEEQEHPYASIVGGFAPSTLAFNPLKSLQNLPSIAKSGVKVFSRGLPSLTTEEAGPLINTAVNVGTSGGVDIAQQLSSGKPFDWGQLGINLAGASLLNEPTSLGAKLFGFHSNDGVQPTTSSDVPKESNAISAKPSPSPFDYPLTPINVTGEPPHLDIANAFSQEPPYPISGKAANAGNDLGKIDAMNKYVASSESTQPEVSRMEGEGNQPQQQRSIYATDFEKAQRELQEQQIRDATIADMKQKQGELGAVPVSANTLRITKDNLLPSNVGRAENIPLNKGVGTSEQRIVQPRQKPKFQEEPVEYPGAIIPVIGRAGRADRVGSLTDRGMPIDEAKKFAESLGFERGKPSYKYQEESQNDQEWQHASPAYRQAINDLASRRGITLEEARGLVNPATGKEVLGQYEGVQRKATLNPNRAELDTPLHEIAGHGYVDDLANSNIASDKKLAQRALDIAGGDKSKAEEAIASKLGVEGVGRINDIIGGNRVAQFNSWFRDFLSRWKYNLGLDNDSDIIRHLSQRSFTDAPHGTRGEILQWAKEEMGRRGINTNRTFNDIDLGNKSIRNAIQNDPTLNAEQKRQLLENGSLKPKFIGEQEGFGSIPSMKLYNLTKEIKDEKGETLYPVGSTVSEKTLQKHGVKYQEEPTSAKSIKEIPLGELGEASKAKKYELDYSTFRPTQTQADSLMKKEGEKARPALNAAIDERNKADEYYNRYKVPLDEVTKNLNGDAKEVLWRTLLSERADSKSYRDLLPNAKEQEAYDKVRNVLKQMQQDRIEANQPVKQFDESGKPSMRPAKIDPHFAPNRLNPEVVEILKQGGEQATALRKIWNDFQQKHGQTPEQSSAGLNAIVDSYSKGASNMAHFRGVDIEQGHGLPFEFMRPGFDKNMEGYMRRYANARAFHDAIESKPEAAQLFGYDKDPWDKEFPSDTKQEPLKSQEAHDILAHLKGEDYRPEEGKLIAIERIGSSLMLGPLTNAHILGSTVANAYSYAKPKEVVGVTKAAFSNFSKSIDDTLTTGLYQKRPKLFRDLFDAHATQQEKLSSLADGIGRLSGRNVTDYYTKNIVQGMGDYLVRRRIPEAQAGDAIAIRLMKHLDPEWTSTKSYGEKDIPFLASNFVRMLHGTHDFRTLPNWMLKDNIIQPFTSLMSWNISQTNQFFRHTITAAKQGNYTPLIMSTLGAALGGYIIKEGREKLANKESPIPSLTELAHSDKGLSGNLPLIAYNFAAMSSFAGYAGLLSTGARSLFDIAYKNPAQGAVFPLDEVVSNTALTMSHAVAAIMNSNSAEDYVRIGSKAVADLFKGNVQLARIGLSWADQSGAMGEERQQKKVLGHEETQLRRFKMAEGLPLSDESTIDESNPYYNLSRKSFQKEQDISKAAQALPSLIQQSMQESGGNIEVLKGKLRALKQSSYPSMPSPEHTPATFWRYVKYLQDTQGEDVASQRVSEYMLHNAINKAKGEMVPSL